jgi:opacity protein-like surface antigen
MTTPSNDKISNASNDARNRGYRALLAAAILAGGSQWACAQSNMGGASYIGLSGGPSDFSRLDAGAGGFPAGNNDTAYNIAYGNYFISPNVGMEVGYTHFGNVSRAGGTATAEGANLSLIGKMPLGESVNVLGKIGTTYGRTDVSANALSGVAQGSQTGFDWSYGLGLEMAINKQWSAVLSYDEHFMKFQGIGSERVSSTMLGARMRF